MAKIKNNFLLPLLITVIVLEAAALILLALRSPVCKCECPGRAERPSSVKKVDSVRAVKIAIVIDDWGYNKRNLSSLDRIKVPLTLAILPNLAFSDQVATYANKRRWEAILHLPLEPNEVTEYSGLEPYTILASMPEQQIRKTFLSQLSRVPFIKGVSNHMGSKATASAKVMDVIISELKKKDMFFLDSVVTHDSVAVNVGERLGVSVLERDIFLDNKQDEEYILSQFEKLIRLARKKGEAIGIGHDRPNTINVIAKRIEELSGDKTIAFVRLSELLN